jgi:CRISPR/Cas system-associated protein endoribonuclease Cas2
MKLIAFFFLLSTRILASDSAHNYNMSLLNEGMKIEQITSVDKRVPVKLTKEMADHQLKNMRDHLEAITAIVEAMSEKDFEKMKKESLRLASTPKMNKMCSNMGKATPGFTEMGLALHLAADDLVHAAEKKNYNQFVKNLSITLHTCTSCHSAFKQEIVSQEELHKEMMKLKK